MKIHSVKTCLSHLIVRGNHTHRHPVGISTDTEGVSAAVCHRSYILLIAESQGMEGGKCENWVKFEKEKNKEATEIKRFLKL